MKKIITALFIFVGLCFLAQNKMPQGKRKKNVDSLWKVYYNKGLADTSRLKALYDISWVYIKSKPDTAIVLAEQELEFAIKTKQIKHAGKAYNTMGAAYMNKGDFEKSIDVYLKSVQKLEEADDKEGVANGFTNIGRVYSLMSDLSKSMEYHLKSLAVREKTGNKQGIGVCYNNIGLIYKEQADFPKALEYHLKALKIFEEIKNLEGVGI